MSENLNVTNFRDGTSIQLVSDGTAWSNLTSSAYCNYGNSISNGDIYGKLYNWYAVNDPRGLCPAGWHVPSDLEWNTLINFLNAMNPGNVGGKIKATGTSLWTSPNVGATNATGLTGLPAGRRDFGGVFVDIGNYGYWWSATESTPGRAWIRALYFGHGILERYDPPAGQGYSVRCIKD